MFKFNHGFCVEIATAVLNAGLLAHLPISLRGLIAIGC